MIDRSRLILVTGATGHQGGAVARRLKTDGWHVRALTRDPEKPQAMDLVNRGIEVVKGDLTDRSTLGKALKGVYGVFVVLAWSEQGTVGEVQQGKNIADAAKAAGVKHLVYSSVAAADQKTGIPHFESKNLIEKYIQALGLPATILRPVFFMYNFIQPQLKSSILEGTLSLPVKPDMPLQMLAVEDLAHFVTMALENPSGHIGKTIDLAGDELTMTRAAECFSDVIGRPVRYAELPVEPLKGYSPDMALMYQWFNEHGLKVADIKKLRSVYPGLMMLETWLRKTGWDKAAVKKAA